MVQNSKGGPSYEINQAQDNTVNSYKNTAGAFHNSCTKV